MRIDVWSDILCPFCHLGRRHLELALEQFEHADETHVVWHSFQLDRNAPAVDDRPQVERVAEKYGTSTEQMEQQHTRMAEDAAAVGLDFRWRDLRGGNSYDAHRLLHYARSVGREDEVTGRVMRAWYSEGAAVGDHDTLVGLAVEAGLEEAAVRGLLAGDDFGIDVRTDEALASQIGISSVPTFVLDQKYGVTGAQPVDVLLGAIRQVWDLQGTEPEMPAGGGVRRRVLRRGVRLGRTGGRGGSGGDRRRLWLRRRRVRRGLRSGRGARARGRRSLTDPPRARGCRGASPPDTRTPRVPGRAHLPLLHSCPGGVQ